MIRRLLNWLRPAGKEPAAARAKPQQTAAPRIRIRPQPKPRATGDTSGDEHLVEFDAEIGGRIEDSGPGKNVLIRNRFVREDTGTRETLKILDDSLVDNGEETGIDPYNTGEFDRSRNWDKRFR